jgi:hypothetical protein
LNWEEKRRHLKNGKSRNKKKKQKHLKNGKRRNKNKKIIRIDETKQKNYIDGKNENVLYITKSPCNLS